jgi:hypothetical protein
MILNHSFFLHHPFSADHLSSSDHSLLNRSYSTKRYQPSEKFAMVNSLTMPERIARCTAMVVNKAHPALSQDPILFSARQKKRLTKSICDSNGLRVFDRNDNDKEVLYFFCLVGKCAKDDCSGKKITITTTSCTIAQALDSGVLVRFA